MGEVVGGCVYSLAVDCEARWLSSSTWGRMGLVMSLGEGEGVKHGEESGERLNSWL